MYSSYFLKWVNKEYPWAKWVATDEDGEVFVYNDEPVIDETIDEQVVIDIWVLRCLPLRNRRLSSVSDFRWLIPVWKESKVKL